MHALGQSTVVHHASVGRGVLNEGREAPLHLITIGRADDDLDTDGIGTGCLLYTSDAADE